MKPLYYILFFVIFGSRYFFVICQDIPSPRREQASTLVGTRLYFFGGYTIISASNEVWYLDLSSLFNIFTPPWHSEVVMPVGYNFGTSCLSPIDNSIFLIGGRTWPTTTDPYSNTSSSVYKFNSKTSQWTTPNINNFNSTFTTRNEIQAVIDNNGKIFIFGGINYNSSTKLFYNDMNILDITTMTWSTPTQSQSVLTYIDYTATLLPNGLIAYIGGYSGSSSKVSPTDMAQVQIFDTKSFTWSAKLAGGSTIASRGLHSAVLTQDGNIIIYGGSLQNNSGQPVTVFSDIAVLNTNSWVWSAPSVSGTSAPPLTQHSAALYKNYMILAFGATSTTNLYTNNIYILDIQNYAWVTTIDQANNKFSYLYIGIGIGAGVIILVVVLYIIGLFIYKNRHKENFIATPGTSRNDHIRETHMSTVYAPGMPPPETYGQTPLYGVQVPDNN
ncbi:galactose oxidase [Gigaspora margarita]|uniref:Galactose oxidase n=1 Tax=Gigaspora margarita TaxID=4874 RepID=A0A8H4A2I4_GIGMA|nr:galactose oxidase [Gigaspora margarita]